MTHNKETVSMLTDALARSYGSSVASVVLSELGLDPHSDEVLPEETVERALAMARTCNQVLSGIDFLTQLSCSAVSQGKGFRTACDALGLDTDAFDIAQRQRIDLAMQYRFGHAALKMQSPVSPDTAQGWLHELLCG